MYLLICLFGFSPTTLRVVAEGMTPQRQATSCIYYGPGWQGKWKACPPPGPIDGTSWFQNTWDSAWVPREHLTGRGNCHVMACDLLRCSRMSTEHHLETPFGPFWTNIKVKMYLLLNSTESHLGLSHLENITQAESPNHILIVSG